jgi:hypothetical protein
VTASRIVSRVESSSAGVISLVAHLRERLDVEEVGVVAE